MGDRVQKSLSTADQIKKKFNAEHDYKIKYGPPFKLFRFSNPVVELVNKKYGNRNSLVRKNHSQPPKAMFLPHNVGSYNLKAPNSFIVK